MLVVSYTILTRTLESKIQRDRQTFVQLIAHLVGDDLAPKRRDGSITTRPIQPVAKIFSARYPDADGAAMAAGNLFLSSPDRRDVSRRRRTGA